MEAYFKKRFTLKEKEKITSLAWNKENSIICAGMENGNLKILKLKASSEMEDTYCEDSKPEATEVELEFEEDLISSHKSGVRNLKWNEEFGKLMSCCSEGVFVVWKQDEQKFLREEMVNEGGKTLIKHVNWSLNGGLLCILIQQGQVVLGDVLGNRLWGRNFKEQFSLASFDKADQLLLLGQESAGARIMVLETEKGDPLMHLELDNSQTAKIVILQSNNKAEDSGVLVCLNTGIFFLVSDILSSTVKRFDRGLSEIKFAQWSSDGKMFALSAKSKHLNGNTCLLIFSQQGNPLHSFPSNSLIRALDFNESSSEIIISTKTQLSVISLRKPDSMQYLEQSKVLITLGSIKRKQCIRLFRVETDYSLKLFRTISASLVLLLKSNGLNNFLILEQVGVLFFNEKDKELNYYLRIFNSDGLQITKIQIPFPSRNIHFSNDSVFIFWGLSCLRISLSNTSQDPKKRLKNLLDGFKNEFSVVNIPRTQSLLFIDLNKIYKMQSPAGSSKTIEKSVVNLSKQEHPFKALKNQLQDSLKNDKGTHLII